MTDSLQRHKEHFQISQGSGLRPTAGRIPKKQHLHVVWCIGILRDLSRSKTKYNQFSLLQCRHSTWLSQSRACARPLISNRKHHSHGHSLSSMTDEFETHKRWLCESWIHFCIKRQSSRLYVMNGHDKNKTQLINEISCEPSRVNVHSAENGFDTMRSPWWLPKKNMILPARLSPFFSQHRQCERTYSEPHSWFQTNWFQTEGITTSFEKTMKWVSSRNIDRECEGECLLHFKKDAEAVSCVTYMLAISCVEHTCWHWRIQWIIFQQFAILPRKKMCPHSIFLPIKFNARAENKQRDEAAVSVHGDETENVHVRAVTKKKKMNCAFPFQAKLFSTMRSQTHESRREPWFQTALISEAGVILSCPTWSAHHGPWHPVLSINRTVNFPWVVVTCKHIASTTSKT